jgi:MFS family permease
MFGMWIRLSLDETPVFKYEQAQHEIVKLPFVDAIRTQWREILLGGGALLMAFCNNYMGASYLINYGTSTLKLSSTAVLGAGIAGGGVTLAIGVVLGGLLSDKFGRRKVILSANIAGCLWALLLFPLLDTGVIALFWLGLTVSTFIAGFAFGVAGSYLSELYQTQFRYTAAALAYSIAAIFGGALPPIVGPVITATFGSYAFSLFLSLLCLIAVICVACLKETRNRDLRHVPA